MYIYSIFFFNDTATTEIYTYGHTLSLHDALPISIEADGLFVIGVAHDVDEVSCSIFGIVNGSQPLLWAVEAHISGKLIRDLLIIFDRRDRRSMILGFDAGNFAIGRAHV